MLDAEQNIKKNQTLVTTRSKINIWYRCYGTLYFTMKKLEVF